MVGRFYNNDRDNLMMFVCSTRLGLNTKQDDVGHTASTTNNTRKMKP